MKASNYVRNDGWSVCYVTDWMLAECWRSEYFRLYWWNVGEAKGGVFGISRNWGKCLKDDCSLLMLNQWNELLLIGSMLYSDGLYGTIYILVREGVDHDPIAHSHEKISMYSSEIWGTILWLVVIITLLGWIPRSIRKYLLHKYGLNKN